MELDMRNMKVTWSNGRSNPEVDVALFLLGQVDWKAILTGRSSRPTGRTALQSPTRWTDFSSG